MLMESHGSENRRRSSRTQRKPLADLTNTQPLSSASSSSFASSLLKPKCKRNPDPKPKPQISGRNPPLTSDLEQTSTGCSSEGAGDGPIPTPKAKEISTDSVGDKANCDKSEQITVYTQRIATGKKCKRKTAPSASSSCPPVGRIRSIEGRRVMDDENVGQQEAFSVPCHKAQKKRCHTVPRADRRAVRKPVLPQDFIEKQRAYFAEIDAFELPEEVVSESDLE